MPQLSALLAAGARYRLRHTDVTPTAGIGRPPATETPSEVPWAGGRNLAGHLTTPGTRISGVPNGRSCGPLELTDLLGGGELVDGTRRPVRRDAVPAALQGTDAAAQSAIADWNCGLPAPTDPVVFPRVDYWRRLAVIAHLRAPGRFGSGAGPRSNGQVGLLDGVFACLH